MRGIAEFIGWLVIIYYGLTVALPILLGLAIGITSGG